MQKVKVAYICDQKKGCSNYDSCGLLCHHTFDEFHTLYGIIHDISELDTDRFRWVGCVNETTYYEEVPK